ncbi:VanW family protein [Vagococcus elongatus]|uniref:VanW family protein n=1 Tax=Vagococcus elongatus TaxID=180344 RepID=UPI0026D48428
MLWNKDKLFCDINPTCYAISLQKEIYKRHLQDLLNKEKFAQDFQTEKLPNVVSHNASNMIKRAAGVNLDSQINKANNIDLACKKINGILIRPGEVFSFWQLVGRISEKKGYSKGRVIQKNKLVLGIGGGICNLSNSIHLLIVHSPLEVTEFHTHSDALAPDEGKRTPLAAGTSVSYNNLDYRFKNNTDQLIQLLVWCEGEMLHAELRSEREFPWSYGIVEENHHFKKEQNKYFRNSKIYKETTDRTTGRVVSKDLIWDNHSEVMYDYSMIPEDQIKNEA